MPGSDANHAGSREIAVTAARAAAAKQAVDVTILDVHGLIVITDYFVICSGGNPRQTKAIYDEVAQGLKKGHSLIPRSTAGLREGDWIVADFLDVVLHLFTPETRSYYRLEELWDDVPSVEVAAV